MKKKNTFYNKIYNLLVGIIIFLIPTNFFLKFSETSAYVNGLRVDYLIPKLYLSDIFISGLLIVWFANWLVRNVSRKRKHWKKLQSLLKKPWTRVIIILFTTFFLRQFFTSHPIASTTYLLRTVELWLFATFLIKNKKIINQNLIEKSILATLVFQSSVAIYQYINQRSLFGYFLLGEPNLNNYIGITKSSLFGVEKILPYGTTAHPNVLGGFLALCLLYIFSKVEWKHKVKLEIPPNTIIIRSIVKNLILILATIVLFLTQSVSAITTFILGIIFIFYPKYWNNKHSKKIKKYFQQKLTLKNIIFLTMAMLLISIASLNLLAKKYPENHSLVRRNYLNSASIDMAKNNILVGVGLNNFTAKVENFSPNREVVRFVQPAHNVFLLFFAETGLLGIATLGVILNRFTKTQRSQITIFQLKNILKNKQKNWSLLLILLPIALLDHYLLTLNTGILLLVFTTIWYSSKTKYPD